MVRVVRRGRFSVYVYAEGGARHHRPHCHVRWSDGSFQVAISQLVLLAGDSLPGEAEELLEEHMSNLIRISNLLNPGRPAQ